MAKLKAYYLDKESNKVYAVRFTSLEVVVKERDAHNLSINRVEFESADGSIYFRRCNEVKRLNYHTSIPNASNITLYANKECTETLLNISVTSYGSYVEMRVYVIYLPDSQYDEAHITAQNFARSHDTELQIVKSKGVLVDGGLVYQYYEVYGATTSVEFKDIIYDVLNEEIKFTPYHRYKDKPLDGIFATKAEADAFILSHREVIDFPDDDEEVEKNEEKKKLEQQLTSLQEQIEEVKDKIKKL